MMQITNLGCTGRGEARCFIGLIVFGIICIIISITLFTSLNPMPQPILNKRSTREKTANWYSEIMAGNTRENMSSFASSAKIKGNARENMSSAISKDVNIIQTGFAAKENQFHHIYNVDCMKLFQGDNATISKLGRKLNSLRNKDGELKVPTDKDVSRWLSKCDVFKEQRGYSSLKSLQLEEDLPIAYVISAHESAAQVERLLRAVYNPANVYCIHPDTKSPPAFQRAIRNIANCFDNVIVASKPVSVMRFNISLVLCDQICMEDLLKFSPKWKYLINLCSTDFPLKTNQEIVEYLTSLNGHNGIWSNRHDKLDNISKRWKYRYEYNMNKGKTDSGETRYYYFPLNTGIEKEPPPHDIEVYQGSRYIAATRKFVDFAVNSQIAKDFLVWLKDTMMPDASFSPTLHMYPSAPGGLAPREVKRDTKSKMRYVTWLHHNNITCGGKFVHAVCVYNSSNLQYLYNADQMFVNKLQYGYDPVTMQCLGDLLDERSRIGYSEQLS